MSEQPIVTGLLHGRTSMFLLGATLALGFTFSAYLIGRAAVKVTQPNQISVKGSAMKLVRSDFGVWSGSVTARAKTIAEGHELLTKRKTAVAAFLGKQGFADGEFFFESIRIEENHKRDAKGNWLPEIEDYTMSQQVTVSSAKVDQLEKCAREFTSLLKEGILVRSYPASFIISDLDKYKMELLDEATKNASERARIIAKSSNGQVGKLISARQGVFQITAPASGSSPDIGEYDKSTIMKEVKAVVTLQFKVE